MVCKFLLAVALLTSVLLLSSCSLGYEFVVINASDELLVVQYTFKPDYRDKISAPVKANIEELENTQRRWTPVHFEQFGIDQETGTVTVKLPPREVLRVADITNYPGHNSEHSDLYFHISSLVLSGSRGSVTYNGKQACSQFKEDSTTYKIIYQ